MAFTLEADFLSRPARPASEAGKRPRETDRNGADFRESLAKLDEAGPQDGESEIPSRTDVGQTAVSAILINLPQTAREVNGSPYGEVPDISAPAGHTLMARDPGSELVPETVDDIPLARDFRAADIINLAASDTADETRATPAPGSASPVTTELPASPDMVLQKVSEPAAPLNREASTLAADATGASGHTRSEPEVQATPANADAPLAASVAAHAGSTDKTQSADAKAPGTGAVAAPASQPATQTPGGNTSGREQSGRDQSITHSSVADREPGTSTPQQAGTASFSDMVTTSRPAASQDMSAVAQPVALHAQAPQPAAPPVSTAFTQTHALITATPAEVVDVMSDSLAAPEDRKNRVIVQLDPPELGRISIDYKFDSQGLQHVTITGESPEAMRQLRLMHFELVNALEKQGLSSQNMSFQQHQANQDPGQQGPRSGQISTDIAENQSPTGAALIASQTSQPGSGSSGGLNIKL
ncbi:flagellar hook-length control protein FliK [Hyphomonas sp.]|uniref:flagellar hook-length control protein FliK n=1 Tax=Hyphomonas sp. TaxID=87 RepID=UPI003D2B5773